MADLTSASTPASDLHARITAFELARREDAEIPVGNFLPAPGHPSYGNALRELLRRDLRSRMRRGDPVRLESYRAVFPLLFDRPDLLNEVAFEEYCQLALAGTAVTPADYQQRYDLDVSDWPPPAALTPSRPTSLLDAQRDFSPPPVPSADEPTFTLRRLTHARDRMPQPGEHLL